VEDIGLSEGGSAEEDHHGPQTSVTLFPSGDDESIEASDSASEHNPQPESSILIIKELDLSRDQATRKSSGGDNSNEQKVAEINSSLEEVKSELEAFKRTSSMERDALRKELDVLKGVDNQKQQGGAKERVEWTKEDSEKGGITGMFASFAGLFDDEGFIKCCLPSDGEKK